MGLQAAGPNVIKRAILEVYLTKLRDFQQKWHKKMSADGEASTDIRFYLIKPGIITPAPAAFAGRTALPGSYVDSSSAWSGDQFRYRARR
jgi:hypothetical protein